MGLLTCVSAVTCPVQMQNQTILASPLSHGLDSGIANSQVNHNDDASQFLGKLSTLVHVFHGCGSDVHVMTLDLTGLCAGFIDGLYAVEVTVTPAHEGLR